MLRDISTKRRRARVASKDGWIRELVKVLRPVTPHVVLGPTSGKRGRLASCLGGVGSFLPTEQRKTWMGRSERGPKGPPVTVSIQRPPKMR